MKIKLKNAIALSTILGKCVVKSLDSKLFIPVIKAKSALSAVSKKYGEMEQDLINQFGFENGIVPEGTKMEDFNKFSQAQKELAESEEEIIDIHLFSTEDIEKLAKENPAITLSEIEVIYDLMLVAA